MNPEQVTQMRDMLVKAYTTLKKRRHDMFRAGDEELSRLEWEISELVHPGLVHPGPPL